TKPRTNDGSTPARTGVPRSPSRSVRSAARARVWKANSRQPVPARTNLSYSSCTWHIRVCSSWIRASHPSSSRDKPCLVRRLAGRSFYFLGTVMSLNANHISAITEAVTKKWTKQRKAEERGRSRATRVYVYSSRVSFSDVAHKILPGAYQHASGGGRFTVSK